MSRLGDLLVAAELLTTEQVAEGLRAQVLWGARLGTNLVELGYLELDALTTVLGHQHGLPGALKSHFEAADPALQRRLAPRVAAQYAAVPLMRAGKRAVIASISPIPPSGLARIARELGVPPSHLIPSLAAELRIRYQLERLYRIERSPRFLRARGTRSEDSQVFQVIPTIDPELERRLSQEELSVVDGIPQPVGVHPDDPPSEPIPEPASNPIPEPIPDSVLEPLPPPPARATTSVPFDPLDGERRRYLRTLADMLADHPDQVSVVARADRLSRTGHARVETLVAPTLQAATHAIFRGRDRDQVGQRAVDAVDRFVPESRAALLLVIRGEAAVSWTGFCRDGTELPPLSVPLDLPGLLPAVIKRKQPTRGSSGDLNALDYLLLASLGARHGELAVCPIMLGDQVIAMFAVATAQKGILDGIDEITMATGAAFARLMRDASQ